MKDVILLQKVYTDGADVADVQVTYSPEYPGEVCLEAEGNFCREADDDECLAHIVMPIDDLRECIRKIPLGV